MSLIPKKFLKYSTTEAFQTDLRAGNISDKSIVFVTEAGNEFIYAQGTYFYGSFSASDAEELIEQVVQANYVVVTTLNSTPDETTTTCIIDGETYTFKVGDEVRVLDSTLGDESTDYYVYYKLYNLKNNGTVATWGEAGSGGGGGMMGTINVNLEAYVNNAKTAGSELIGVQATLVNTSDSVTVDTKTLTSGTVLVFDNVTPMKNYSISVTSIANYTQPATQTITELGIGTTVTKTFSYKADQYTVNIVSNQGTDESISGAKVTYNGTEYGNGATFKVVEGTSVSPSASAMSDITGYAKSISTSNKVITATYSTTRVYLNMVGNNSGTEGPAPSGAKGTVAYSGGASQVLSNNSTYAKVPTGTQFTVTYSPVNNYTTPATYSGTATNASLTVTKAVYQSGTFTLYFSVSDNDSSALAQASASVKVNDGSAVTLTNSNNTITGLNDGDVVSITAGAIEGYATPSINNVTMQNGTGSATAAYLTTIYHVSLTSNQTNDSTISAKTVSLSYVYAGTTVTKTDLGGDGQTSDVKVPSIGLTSGPTLGNVDVTGYTSSVGSTGQNFVVAYTTELLTVNLTADSGTPDLSGVTITVINTSTSQTIATATGSLTNQKIPSGTSYKVSVSGNITGYATPSDSATYSASNGTNASRSITMTYEEVKDMVDLGLPSGVKWCNHNIGGTNPEDYGYYFSWGNVEGHAKGSGYNFNSSTYNSTPGHSLTGNIAVGDTYDIARNVMGSPWRLPTRVEFKELYDNTDSEWVSNYNNTGVAGRKFMKKSDHSVYIFFPACGFYNGTALSYEGTYGFYWSSTFYSSSDAYYLNFDSSNVYPEYFNLRYYGFSGRAVQ